jgi:hypothetical protein
MSADGLWIAFTDGQLSLCDRQRGTITPVSVAPDGISADGPSGLVYGHEGYSGSLSLSADGRWLAFTSQASNLVPGQTKDERCQRPLAVLPDTPHCYDVYLYDRETGVIALLGGPWRTAVVPAPTPTPLSSLDALATYVPVTDDAGPIVEALASEIVARLNAALPEGSEPVAVQQVDLTGDGVADLIVTHGYAGASGFRTNPRAYRWHEGDFQLMFVAELTSWAGYSTSGGEDALGVFAIQFPSRSCP